MDAESRTPVGEPLVGVTSYLEWAGDEALLYITMDEILRPDKVILFKLEEVNLLSELGDYNYYVILNLGVFNLSIFVVLKQW